MNPKQIGHRLLDERNFRGWTQSRVVEELNFPSHWTSRTIGGAENPQVLDRPPSLRVIMALLDLYGLELAIVRKGTYAEETEARELSDIPATMSHAMG